tara:strand:- start:754 stop:1968 length:1215 start_codon:yes stop_codon:yes gene_type:complete
VSESQPAKQYYFVSAGEPSGDLLAADLVEAIGEAYPELIPVGIVGPRMREIGVTELARIEDLTVMGFVEVIKHLVPIQQLEDQVIAQLFRLEQPPLFAVLTDYPGFHMHLAERLKLEGIPVVQYVAPQLWAWGANRTKRLKKVTDLVLGIMPFEVEFFQNRGVDCRYIGTPQVDRVKKVAGNPLCFADGATGVFIGLFPGSRPGELRRILPHMLAVAQHIIEADQSRSIAVSIAPSIRREWLDHLLKELGYEIDISSSCQEAIVAEGIRLVFGNSMNLMERVDAALVTSGTATLECGLTLTPMAVMYVASPITYFIAKRLVKLDRISLVNLVAGKTIINEYVQEFDVEEIAQHLIELSRHSDRRASVLTELDKLGSVLKGSPGKNAAQSILTEFYSPKPVSHSQ